MTLNQAIISSTTLSTPAAAVTIPVPSGYTDLRIVVSARKVETGGSNLQMRFNGSTSGYLQRTLVGNGSSVASYSDNSEIGFMYVPTASETANTFGNTEIYIPEYSSSNNKSVQIDCVTENNATSAVIALTSASWANSAAISSVYFQIANGAGTFAAGSSFTLYGISKLGVTPTLTPKATGGDIIKNDGTYWYHAFLSTGAFIPQTTLSCDYLVVAGGGGGGSYYHGAGGGAGGLRAIASQSISSSTVITVGAGGAGGISGGDPGVNGGNSSVGSYTVTGGGGGGSTRGDLVGFTGKAGGSGGGAPSYNSSMYGAGNAGSYSPVEGYAGGTAPSGAPYYGSGGGGGASAAGANGGNTYGGAGGAGTDTYNSINFSSWLTATGTGSSSKLAGGGGGSAYDAGSYGAGGVGGGGRGANQVAGFTFPVAGTVNTGGGGGGAERSEAGIGAQGGSGIVIIRYAMA